ncbi:Hsp20/alpha crystallin family protein [Solirhodobacter olei]|uniref:Hsp20/alpha crystallin family protein n=1 Tax=Solirhodobacter olei TaxID=2493082 RepID=UPI000FD700D6|nr:Hsp20/alpha crystallin family protein [Solirhodobacter olei]
MAETPTKLAVQSTSAPQPREPERWAPFDMLRREVDRLFDDFLPSRRRTAPYSPMSWPTAAEWPLSPVVDVVEENGGFRITAELPGIDPKDIEVKVSDGLLTIRGEKTQEEKEEDADYYMCERRYGSFQRSFGLPDSVDADKTEASYANGVLTLTLPKSSKAKASQKTIEVKAA